MKLEWTIAKEIWNALITNVYYKRGNYNLSLISQQSIFEWFIWKSELPVEVVHGKAGIAGNLVETLACYHSLLHNVQITEHTVI